MNIAPLFPWDANARAFVIKVDYVQFKRRSCINVATLHSKTHAVHVNSEEIRLMQTSYEQCVTIYMCFINWVMIITNKSSSETLRVDINNVNKCVGLCNIFGIIKST